MAYNFNPREKPKRQMKFDEYEKTGMIKWHMVPIGTITVNKKYLTPCSNVYQDYNNCLR